MRISGNMTQVQWLATSGGSAVSSAEAINVAESSEWDMDVDYVVERTDVLASDSPRVDIGMRNPPVVRVRIWANDGSLPGGFQRMPPKNSSGVHPDPLYLRLILDKANPTVNYYELNAFLFDIRIAGRARGGPKVQYELSFVGTGSFTQVTASSSSTIR